MVLWIEWIKKIIGFKEATDEEGLKLSLDSLKNTLALILENVDDTKTAQVLNQAFQGTMPEFVETPSGTLPDIHGGGDILLTPGSVPVIQWTGVDEYSRIMMKYRSEIEKYLSSFSIAAECLSLGQMDKIFDTGRGLIDRDYLTSMGFDMQRIQAEEFNEELWRQSCKKRATIALPNEDILLKMHQKGIITDEELKESLSRFGYHEEWTKAMKQNALLHPDISTLAELVRKQIITLDEFKEKAKIAGFELGSIELMSQIIEPMHSTSSLIEFVVKEVITPEDFTVAMKKQGWPAAEAEKYWAAHWRLVSLDDLRDMRNRGYITDEKYKEELIKHDYPPEWADEIIKLSYRRPTLAQLRQLTEYTEFTDEEIEKIISDLGFEESWIPMMRKYLKSRRLMLERTRLITELENQYIKGWMTKEQLKDELNSLGFSSDVIDMRMKKAQLRDDRERADDLKDVYVKAYRNDYITIEELTTNLTALGLREKVLESIIALETVRKKPSAS